jgi:NADH-quinone oxidoreductase subunit A
MVGEVLPALLLLIVAITLVAATYGAGLLLGLARRPLMAPPFLSGLPPVEHAVSRFHVRWYTVAMVFLAFDMEMIFMYPWTLVVLRIGSGAVVEMFVFLGILLAGVAYAWREGAFRWT